MAQPSYYVETPDGKKVQLDVPEGASAEQIRTLAGRALKQKFPDAKYARPAMSREASQSLLPESARGELKADDTALSKVQGGVRSALEAVGVGDRYGAHLAGRVTGALNDLTPVGDAVTLSDAKDAWNSGNYVGAVGRGVLAGVGLVPGVGDALAAGGKGALRDWLTDKAGKPLRVFHGTNQPFDAFDRSRGGMSTGENAGALQGFFFTDNPDEAAEYAANASRRVPADVSTFERERERLQSEVSRLEREANRTGDWEPYERAMEDWENLEIGATQEDEWTGANIRPANVAISNPFELDFGGGQNHYTATDYEETVAKAIAAGHDGMILKNVNDSPRGGYVSNHYVVFTPEQIRSVFEAR